MVSNDSRSPDSSIAEDETVHFEWDQNGRPSASIVDAVATVTDSEISEMPPLHEVVDPDALNRILDPSVDSADRDDTRAHVSFQYHGVRVRADPDVQYAACGGSARDVQYAACGILGLGCAAFTPRRRTASGDTGGRRTEPA